MPMKTVQRGIEDYSATYDREDAHFASGHLTIPKFQMAPIFLEPILIEIYDQVQATLEFHLTVDIEIGVNAQMSARPG